MFIQNHQFHLISWPHLLPIPKLLHGYLAAGWDLSPCRLPPWQNAAPSQIWTTRGWRKVTSSLWPTRATQVVKQKRNSVRPASYPWARKQTAKVTSYQPWRARWCAHLGGKGKTSLGGLFHLQPGQECILTFHIICSSRVGSQFTLRFIRSEATVDWAHY